MIDLFLILPYHDNQHQLLSDWSLKMTDKTRKHLLSMKLLSRVIISRSIARNYLESGASQLLSLFRLQLLFPNSRYLATVHVALDLLYRVLIRAELSFFDVGYLEF